MKQRLTFFGIIVIIGTVCLLTFNWIGSTVDSNGVLHEPFALLPIGYLIIVVGVVGFVVTMLQTWRSK